MSLLHRRSASVRAGREFADGLTILFALVAGGLLAMPPSASAAQAYKCTAADGSISFQDRPCAAHAHQQRLQLPDDPPPPPESAPAAVAVPPPAQPAMGAAPVAPSVLGPDVFLCVRYDGSRYLSDTGIGDRYAVPYGVLGDSGGGLAHRYGGRDGIGVSAPGLHAIPALPAGEAPFAAAHVQVEDACHRATPQEACAYMREQIDEVRGKLDRAFSDTRADLERQQRAWRMRGC